MANNNVTGPRASSVTLPVQDDVTIAPVGVPTGIAPGHPGTSSLDPEAKTVTSTTIAGATPISPNAVKVAGTAVTVGAATEAARAESSKVKTLADQGKSGVGVVKTGHSLVKKLGVVADDEASTGERVSAAGGAVKEGLTLARSTKVIDKLSSDTIRNLKVGGYGAGAVVGALNVVSNSKELRENLGKALDGDKKALADSVNNAAQIVSGAARVVSDVSDGAKLAAVALAAPGVLGAALRLAPIAGAAVGSVKAFIDLKNDMSTENGLKLAANLIGVLPLPGASAISMGAVMALQNPKVMAAATGAVDSTANFTGRVFTGVAKSFTDARTMEPLGLSM